MNLADYIHVHIHMICARLGGLLHTCVVPSASSSQVESSISVIEYRQLRREWLAYQRRLLDVVAFARKTKIIFRGDR